MRRASIFVITVFFGLLGKSLAFLVKSASYEDTTLEYYDDVDDRVVQSGAMARCWQLGGWLVMPKDESLDQAVGALSGSNNVWIGLGDFGFEGAYEYIDGSRVRWTNWRNGEPNNGLRCNDEEIDESCVEMNYAGWNDRGCFRLNGYVCQIPNSQRDQYYYNHLKVHQEAGKSTYEVAADICRTENSRLARINNDYSIKLIYKKLPELAELPFWVSKIGTGSSNSLCFAASSKGAKRENCQETRPVVCETVEPHNVKVSKEKLEVDASDDLQIHCSAFGVPTPEVTWFHNDVEIIDQLKKEGHSTMKLHDVTADDAGLYVCHASNVINDRQYTMEAYSFVTVLLANDESIRSNTRSATDGVLSRSGPNADPSRQGVPYDDTITNSQREVVDPDPQREGFAYDVY